MNLQEEQDVVQQITEYLTSQVPPKTSTRIGPITFSPSPRGSGYILVHVQRLRTKPNGQPGDLFFIEELEYEVVLGARRIRRTPPQSSPGRL